MAFGLEEWRDVQQKNEKLICNLKKQCYIEWSRLLMTAQKGTNV